MNNIPDSCPACNCRPNTLDRPRDTPIFLSSPRSRFEQGDTRRCTRTVATYSPTSTQQAASPTATGLCRCAGSICRQDTRQPWPAFRQIPRSQARDAFPGSTPTRPGTGRIATWPSTPRPAASGESTLPTWPRSSTPDELFQRNEKLDLAELRRVFSAVLRNVQLIHVVVAGRRDLEQTLLVPVEPLLARARIDNGPGFAVV